MQVGICANHSVRLQTNKNEKKNQVMYKIEIKFDFPVLIHNSHSAKIHRNE